MTNDDQRDVAVAQDGGAGDPYYAYKPAMLGAPWEFALRERGLEWQFGRRNGTIRYDRIQRVRLSFRPMTMQSYRFLTEIWSSDGPKLRIASTSWRNLVEQQRHDVEYVAFVKELHRRLDAADTGAQFAAGSPVPVYWMGVVLLAGILAIMLFVGGRGLIQGDWIGAAVMAGLVVLFGWQIGNFLRRNRPLRYRPDAIPENVLPNPNAGLARFRRAG
ncbi:MAG: hypothetical protein FJX62_02600 [Alphaproteobacteria bacterium]|nr:hypothetical protein [Alphaproteobacteria bacterium]